MSAGERGRDPGMKLPMAGGSGDDPPGAAGESSSRAEPAKPGGPGGVPQKPEASSFRLVATLALAGAIAGLVIVLVHQWSDPLIQENRARVLREAIYEVLGGPERYETAFLVDGTFTTEPPPSADTASLERVYVGYDAAGSPVGVAVAGEKAGFQDVIRLLFGYDPADGEVIGMKVLENKETPGLGDKIVKDSAFVGEFAGVAAPIEGVKAGAGDGDQDEVDMITGATISSRAVIDIINARVETLGSPLASWWSRGLAAGPAGGGR